MLPLISSLEEILEPRFLSSPKISNRKYRALQGKTAGWLTSVVEGVFFFFFYFRSRARVAKSILLRPWESEVSVCGALYVWGTPFWKNWEELGRIPHTIPPQQLLRVCFSKRFYKGGITFWPLCAS